MKPILALTIGDSAGIGPEVTVKAIPGEIALGRSTPVIYGDARIVVQEAEKYASGWSARDGFHPPRHKAGQHIRA